MKLIDAYPQMYTGNGPVSDVTALGVPWALADAAKLDIAYAARSGQKTAAPLIDIVADGTAPASADARAKIANALHVVYSEQWETLYNIYNQLIPANPLGNYDYAETYTGESSDSQTRNGSSSQTVDRDTTDAGTVGHAGTDTRTNTGTETTAGTGQTDRGVYGFNSASSVDSETETSTDSQTRTDNLQENKTSNQTETRNLTGTEDVTTTASATDETAGEHEDSHTLTRTGRQGMTAAEAVERSRSVLFDNFATALFDMLDEMLTLPIY